MRVNKYQKIKLRNKLIEELLRFTDLFPKNQEWCGNFRIAIVKPVNSNTFQQFIPTAVHISFHGTLGNIAIPMIVFSI